MNQWLPLETIPIDMSPVLLDFTHLGYVAVVAARPEMSGKDYAELGARGWVPCGTFGPLSSIGVAYEPVATD